MDPLTREAGNAQVKKENQSTYVKLSLEPGKSCFLKTETKKSLKDWIYYEPSTDASPLKGKWQITFEKGGPQKPADAAMSDLKFWTLLNSEAESFSGTATYTLEFNNPDSIVKSWSLNLGDVRESAKVWLNGHPLGTAWSVPYSLHVDNLKPGKNTLKIQVTNLPANRLRAMELNGQEWKIFYEINMADKDYKKFDATKWEPMPSGLLGPVTLIPVKELTNPQ